jgi:hypothetical protein
MPRAAGMNRQEAPTMTLNRDRYECPEHHTDLTGLVEEALDELGPPVAYRRDHPFKVIITCPGIGGTGPHPLTCTGTQTR